MANIAMGLIRSVIVNRSNIKKICRICLEQKSKLRSLYTSIEFKDENLLAISIPDLLRKLTSESVQSDDALPNQICIDCIDLLKSAYLFKLKFEESSDILRNYLYSDVKTESENIKLDASFNDTNCDFGKSLFDNANSTMSLVKLNENYHTTSRKTENEIKQDEIENTEENIDKPHSTRNVLLYPCPICTMEFPAFELKQHAHNHKALQKYLTIPKIKENIKFYAKPRCTVSIFNQRDILHKCPYCNENFPAQQFRIHVDNHRKQDEFKCDKCNRVFRKLNHLNTHRIKHLKEFPYKCRDCGKGFVIKTNYDCHVLIHTNNELPHECSYCLKRFSNPEHLHRHQMIHTENIPYSVKYKVYKCHHCFKTFKDKSDLKKHVCAPIEQMLKRRFRCKTCSKVFKHSSGLYNHIRNIHKLSQNRIFTKEKTLCSICGNYVSNIYDHMIRHSGEKPYKCNECDKQFAAKPQLKQHLLVHSGLKPYVCSVCAKAFNNLYNLQVHERIHKGDRCHICPVCHKGFLEKSYLKKHMNVHKNIN